MKKSRVANFFFVFLLVVVSAVVCIQVGLAINDGFVNWLPWPWVWPGIGFLIWPFFLGKAIWEGASEPNGATTIRSYFFVTKLFFIVVMIFLSFLGLAGLWRAQPDLSPWINAVGWIYFFVFVLGLKYMKWRKGRVLN